MAGAVKRITIPIGARMGAVFVVLLLAALVAGAVAAGFLLFQHGNMPGAALLFGLAAALTVMLFFVLRDCMAKLFWSVTVQRDGARLFLPAWRSLRHHREDFSGRIAYSGLKAIEMQPETYRQFGFETTVHTYWLVLMVGGRILLAEDREVNRRGDHTSFGKRAAEAIADASGKKLVQRRAQVGKAGVLGIWGAKPPVPN